MRVKKIFASLSVVWMPAASLLSLTPNTPGRQAQGPRKVGGARVGGTWSGGGGMFGKALGNIAGAAVGHVPGGSGAAAGAARSAAVGGVHTTAGLASQVKAKDELSLDYRLESAAGARPVVSRAEKAKADGEDVLTPLVERAAAAMVAAARK